MKNLPSLALLVIFSCIGLLTGKFGLWFPLGLAAAVILAVVRNGRKTDDR